MKKVALQTLLDRGLIAVCNQECCAGESSGRPLQTHAQMLNICFVRSLVPICERTPRAGLIGIVRRICRSGVAALAIPLLACSFPAGAQDAENGAEVFKKCRACHQVGEGARNVVGPKLNGILGRRAGTIEGFGYSRANSTSATIWDPQTLTAFINDPKAAMPGNRMAFSGLKDEQDVADLIAYLTTFDVDGRRQR